MLIAGILLASTISLVFASENDENANTENSDAQVQSEVDSENVVADMPEDAVVKVKSIRQSIDDRIAKKKELLNRAKKFREESREALKDVKDELKEAKQKLRESKVNFESAKDELEKCKGIQSDNCKKSRKDAKTHVAKLVDGSIEHIYRTLEKAVASVEASGLSEEQKTALNADLNSKLQEINAFRQTQGQIQAQSSLKEIKDAAKKVHDFWKSNKDSVKESNARITIAKLGGIVQKMESLQLKLNKRVEDFKAQGKDTVDVESKISAFNEKLDSVKSLQGEVESLLDSLDSADDTSAVMKAAVDKMREAHAQIKDAHIILKEVQNSIRTQEALSAGLNE